MKAVEKPSVLIVGSREDAHVAQVRRHLCHAGVSSCLVSPSGDDGCPSIAVRISRGTAEVAADGGEVALEGVQAVWWRLKPTVDRPGSETDRLASDFCDREWRHVFEAFEVTLVGARWMNPRAVDRRVRYKPAQLLLAQQCGFRTPETIVSNDPAAIEEFLNAQGGTCIYKPLTWFYEPPDRILFTNPADAEFVRGHSGSVRRAPGIYQPRIAKAFELRITVVGEKAFAARIESQASSETQLDWRRRQLELSYSEYELGGAFRERLFGLHRSLRLVYGAYDFIVTPEGEEVFLEVNPAGQWLWIEEKTGCPISEAVAAGLTGRS
jgi:hypothetical protein